MTTLSCSCGLVATTRRNPFAGLGLAERLALVEAAWSVEDGFLVLELDGAWHPAHGEPDEACVLLADLDEVDATAGLGTEEAARLRAALAGARLGGLDLPLPHEAEGLRVRVRPAREFAPALLVTAEDADGPALDAVVAAPADVPSAAGEVLAAVVALHARHGRAGLVALDRLAGRHPLLDAVAAVERALAAHAA
ncbi:hypothetical protein [Cellulomonas endophytica]|uniref:hypothetical protein n=1 Tax=Cellulomonas endophytica TaxID=2494735 RepID=UPI001012C78C|nr:hypothetical protein [Cellulomonas endophytica]